MGLLTTLYLITCNVYGSTEAPPNRGFSNIEVWITGVQICILLAVFEYSVILVLKRFYQSIEKNIEKCIKTIDLISLAISSIFFMIFNGIYWQKCFLNE